MTDRPSADTMVIQMAITNHEKSWVAQALLSEASLELQVVNSVWTFLIVRTSSLSTIGGKRLVERWQSLPGLPRVAGFSH